MTFIIRARDKHQIFKLRYVDPGALVKGSCNGRVDTLMTLIFKIIGALKTEQITLNKILNLSKVEEIIGHLIIVGNTFTLGHNEQ